MLGAITRTGMVDGIFPAATLREKGAAASRIERMNGRILFCLMLALAADHSQGAAADGTGKNTPLPGPALPPIRSLKIEPAALTLEDGRDERRVLVWGETASGQRFDVTDDAVLKSESPDVEIGKTGYLQPKSQGKAEVTVSLGPLKAKFPVTIKDAAVPEIHFVRDVQPVLSKLGCNAGTCHGSAKGKNGFKLSLRGYDPEYDYQALINDLSGRRFNRVNVDESLMLLKPTAEVPHEGRQPLKPGAREYQIIRQSIAVLPSEVELDLAGRAQHLLVLAHYPDGRVREITRDAILSSNNGDVAEVKNGLVTGLRRGEAAVLVRYEGCYATKLVTVMGDRTGYKWQDLAEYNYIDKFVDAKLKKMKILPSELCTDAEFIRRVSLDLTGLPPTPEKVRAFLADKTPGKEKREKLIDELLAGGEYNEY